MGDQNVTIQPGKVATLSVRLDSGATIQNQDDAAAVWVSASPSVAPGVGTRIGPKGSVQWTTDRAPCYAITDSAVATPVSMTVSTDVAMPVNPVDIGTAVATQLLARGVPNVLLQTEIPYEGFAHQHDVGGFASLTVRVFKNTPGVVFYEYTADEAGWSVIGSRTFVLAETGYLSFTTKVMGPYIRFGGTDLSNVLIIGTNRDLGDKVISTDVSLSVNRNSTWTNGTMTPIPDSTFISNGGLHTIRLAVTNNGRGFLTFKSADTGNTLYDAVSVSTSMNRGSPNPAVPAIMETMENVNLPAGLLTFGFLSYVTGTFQVVLQVTPTT